MTSAIDFLPTISSCQAVSQINRATARWGPHAGNVRVISLSLSFRATLQGRSGRPKQRRRCGHGLKTQSVRKSEFTKARFIVSLARRAPARAPALNPRPTVDDHSVLGPIQRHSNPTWTVTKIAPFPATKVLLAIAYEVLTSKIASESSWNTTSKRCAASKLPDCAFSTLPAIHISALPVVAGATRCGCHWRP